MWEDPNNPKWEKLKFPLGTCVFKVSWHSYNYGDANKSEKILMTDASVEEVSFLKESPTMKAVSKFGLCQPCKFTNAALQVIAEQPTKEKHRWAGKRNDRASDLRLLQVDFAVRDDRAPIGWVFGTFMYDGNQKQENVSSNSLNHLRSWHL